MSNSNIILCGSIPQSMSPMDSSCMVIIKVKCLAKNYKILIIMTCDFYEASFAKKIGYFKISKTILMH